MLSSGRNAPGAYQNMTEGAVKLYQTEGIKGFYRGLLPSLFGVSHGAIQFVAYEQLKHHRQAQLGPGTELSNWDYLSLSGLSKIFAGSITYPYQVIRSRLQTYNAGQQYQGLGDVVVQVWKREGPVGFYKGYKTPCSPPRFSRRIC
jgi:solute carrier family 25 (mitochondrial folate transporter), member 32